MSLFYSQNSPLRIAAFGEHYSEQLYAGRLFATIEEARKVTPKGDWICSVSLLDTVVYFTCLTPRGSLKAGSMIGRWNELTLIEQSPTTLATKGNQ